MPDDRAAMPPRTLLEQLIRQRCQTYPEFVESVERFARDHGEDGTLSIRHVQRLAAGHRGDGLPLGAVRPATARLLRRIFDRSIQELLGPAWPEGSGEEEIGPHPLRVAVAIVVKGRDVLVVRPRDGAVHRAVWRFPAGIVKPGAEPREVAVGETLAETGVHGVVVRELGSRQHPATNVLCDYLLCDYLAGEATNADASENAGVTWVAKADITRCIPREQVYPPVLVALGVPA
jgi:8-oxo-dGTP diphosphatase